MVFKYSWRHVANVMTRDVVTLTEEDSVCDAASLMIKHHISSVVIISGSGARKRVRGIVTEHDMLSVIASRKCPDDILVSSIMTRDPVTVHPLEDFMIASSLMEKHGVKKLPVVEAGYLVGIITLSDITHALNELNNYYSFRLSTFEVPVSRPIGSLMGSRVVSTGKAKIKGKAKAKP